MTATARFSFTLHFVRSFLFPRSRIIMQRNYLSSDFKQLWLLYKRRKRPVFSATTPVYILTIWLPSVYPAESGCLPCGHVDGWTGPSAPLRPSLLVGGNAVTMPACYVNALSQGNPPAVANKEVALILRWRSRLPKIDLLRSWSER